MRPVLLLLCGLLLAATIDSLAWADPDPAQVYLSGFAYQGTGCKPGTASANVSPDAQAITVLFSDYTATGGLASPAHQQMVITHCLVSLKMHVPAGWQFAVHRVDYRGYASVQAGAWGRQSSMYKWLQERQFQPLAFIRFNGPYDGDYQDFGVVQGITYSGCRPHVATVQDLFIRSEITAAGRTQAYLTIDSLDHAITEQYRMTWRPCQIGRG